MVYIAVPRVPQQLLGGCKSLCPTRVLRESVPQRFSTRIPYNSFPYKSVLQQSPTRVSHKTVPQFHKSISYKSVVQECQTMVGRLLSSDCVRSGSWAPSRLCWSRFYFAPWHISCYLTPWVPRPSFLCARWCWRRLQSGWKTLRSQCPCLVWMWTQMAWWTDACSMPYVFF